MPDGIIIDVMMINGALQTTYFGIIRRVSGLQIIEVGMLCDGAGLLHELIRYPLQLGRLLCRKDIRDAGIPVFLIKCDLFLG
jgi:hypothetical protein